MYKKNAIDCFHPYYWEDITSLGHREGKDEWKKVDFDKIVSDLLDREDFLPSKLPNGNHWEVFDEKELPCQEEYLRILDRIQDCDLELSIKLIRYIRVVLGLFSTRKKTEFMKISEIKATGVYVDGEDDRSERLDLPEEIKCDCARTIIENFFIMNPGREGVHGFAADVAKLGMLLFTALLSGRNKYVESILSQLIEETEECICSWLKKKEFVSADSDVLVFCRQLLMFADKSINAREKNLVSHAVACSTVFYSLLFFDREEKASLLSIETKIEIAKRALNQRKSVRKNRVLGVLIDLLIQKGNYQYAYDAGMTGIIKQNVGHIKRESLIKISWGKEDFSGADSFEQRRYYSSRIALCRAFAEACKRIGDYYEPGTEQFEAFYSKAEEAEREALEMASVPYAFRRLEEDILNELIVTLYRKARGCLLTKRYDDALVLLDRCISRADEKVRGGKGTRLINIKTQRSILYCYRDKLLTIYLLLKGDSEKWSKSSLVEETINHMEPYLERYYETICNLVRTNQYHRKTEVMRKVIKEYLSTAKRGKNEELAEKGVLFLIDALSSIILESLKRHQYTRKKYSLRERSSEDLLREYQPQEDNKEKRSEESRIAYYTTLSNADHLFDELVKDENGKRLKTTKDSQKGVNCLTVMNVQYMNDPLEGKKLFQAVNAPKLFDPVRYGEYCEQATEGQLVFLKSFTDQVDDLVMWNRYASDYDAGGHNSNGCCVVFDPESFERILHEETYLSTEDDYSLYRVIYVTNDGNVEAKDNPGMEHPLKLFEYLQSLFSRLDMYSLRFSRKKAEIIERVLFSAFGKLCYLFKDRVYAGEHESRLIIRREKNSSDIRVVGGNLPGKLAVNPFFQIYVQEIVLGPNTRNGAEWKPYLDYKLGRMWMKYEPGECTGASDDETKRKCGHVSTSKVPYWC